VKATLEQRYADAFERYVDAPREEALSAAYDIGRSAVRQGHSMFELAMAHHDALLAATANGGDRDAASLMRAGGEFFLEAVAAFEVLQRVLRDAQETAVLERRHAMVLRQLSTFLADASLALGASDSFEEMLRLVAEHAREVIGAGCCRTRLALEPDAPPLEVEAHSDDRAVRGGAAIAVSLTALDGRDIGSIELFGKPGGGFTELDEAVLAQLAQMASAAVERTQLYQR
jgi:GAF domain-containing protein